MESSSFPNLRLALERCFGVLGILDKIIHEGGSPYKGQEWQKFRKEMEIKIVKCNPYYPQCNRIMKRFNAVLITIVHAAITEGREPRTEVEKSLLNHWKTMHKSRGYFPVELIMEEHKNKDTGFNKTD